MKYILVFWVLWAGGSWGTMTVEPFNSPAECKAGAESLWEIVQTQGAIAYRARCDVSDEMET